MIKRQEIKEKRKHSGNKSQVITLFKLSDMDFKMLTINVFKKDEKLSHSSEQTEIHRRDSNGNSRTKNNTVLKLRIKQISVTADWAFLVAQW